MRLTTLQLNNVAENVTSIDEQLDGGVASLANQERVVVDSRMAWHLLPGSFRVYLIVSPEEAARRIMDDRSRDTERYASLSDAIGAVAARARSERVRFFKIYGVEVSSFRNYDFVIDTAGLEAAQVVEYVAVGYKLWLSKLHLTKALVSPAILFPSRCIDAPDAFEIAGKVASIDRLGITLFDAPTAVFYNGQHIIVKGHRNVIAAIKAGVAAVPVEHVNDDGVLDGGVLTTQAFVRKCVTKATILDWEHVCGIKLPLFAASRS